MISKEGTEQHDLNVVFVSFYLSRTFYTFVLGNKNGLPLEFFKT